MATPTPTPSVPDPTEAEQIRDLAESVADMHKVLSIIVENRADFVPGESVDELWDAWIASSKSVADLVEDLKRKAKEPLDVPPPPPDAGLLNAELLGKTGKAKRSFLRRLKEAFYAFWYSSQPRSEETRTKAAEAAVDYLEFGATVAGSIPGAEYFNEVISLVRQLISMRLKRKRQGQAA
jgi:hypothetical protein